MNARGNITIMVIAGLFITGAGLAYVARAIPQLQKTEAHSAELVSYQTALSSAVGYMTHAIRERWCLTPQLTQNTCPTEINSWASDNLNTERLLISQPRLTDAQFGINVRLNRSLNNQDALLGTARRPFNVTLPIKDIANSHPLFIAAKALRDLGKVKAIKFVVRRINNVNLPLNGNEIFLQIHAELDFGVLKILRGLSVAGRGANPFMDSTIGFFPREINTFALMVANDLHLDSANGEGGQGDFYIPSYKAKADVPKVTSGLYFTSPVFINGNLVVSASKANGGNGAYNATIFGDTVVFGGGRILESQSGRLVTSQPQTAGGVNDQFLTQLTSGFGGLLQGMSKDASRDRGLDYLFKTAAVPGPGAQPDNALMLACIDRNKMQTDLTFSAKSSLAATGGQAGGLLLNNPITVRFNLALTYQNAFTTQFLIPTSINFQNQPGIKTATNTSANNGRPVAQVSVLFPFPGAPSTVLANVAIDGVVSITASDPANRAIASSANVTLSFSPKRINGNIQPDQLQLDVAMFGMGSIPVAPVITIKAYELGSDGAGGSRREIGTPSVMQSNNIQLSFQRFPAFLSSPYSPFYQTGNLAQGVGIGIAAGLPNGLDATELIQKCLNGTRVADYEQDFSRNSRASWRFADYQVGGVTVATYSMASSDYNRAQLTANIKAAQLSKWPVYTMTSDISSAPGQCVIPPTATDGVTPIDFVTGFYVCDRLIILPRTRPLRIIGTFLVGSTSIHQSAISSGIVWSSIFNPQAIDELKSTGRLGQGMSDCNAPSGPSWSPVMSDQELFKLYLCNPNSLRVADPFRWTMVEPDCGLVAGQPGNVCKRRPMRYTVKVISSGGNL